MLIGPPGAGKSTLSRELVQRLGAEAAVVSYAACRKEVSGDPSDPAADPQAGKLLRHRVEQRCAARLTTIVDGTHHLARSRAALLVSAREAGLPAVAVVLSQTAAAFRSPSNSTPLIWPFALTPVASPPS